MNKKNLLLTLALPTLILCACGNNENKDSSSKSEASTSETSTSETSSETTVNYEVDEKTWGSSFDSVTSYTATSAMKSENAISTTVTCLTPSLVKMSQYTQESESAASKLVSDIYSAKNSDGTYEEYTYVASEDLYALTSKKASNYWQFSSSLLTMFKNGYSSFSYDAEKKGYYASSVAYSGDEAAYSAKNVTIRFSNNKLVDIDFDVYGDDGVTVLSHGLINEIGSTSVSLPDSSKVKSGLLANGEAWMAAWLEVENGKNVTYKGESSETGASFSTLFTPNAIHKTSVTVDSGKTTSTDVYYSVEGEKSYVYTKDSSGKYAKKADSSTLDRYAELATLVGFFHGGYSLFSYDKTSDTYKAKQIDDPLNPGKVYTNAVASFSKGKLVSLTYVYDKMNWSIDSIGTTVVTLPSSDNVYPDGQVNESTWKNAFASASSEFNFSYDGSCEYSTDSYSYSVDEKYIFQGNSAEYKYEQHYGDLDPTSTHYYYSLEEGKCYQYSSSDSEYTWKKAESSANVFDDVKNKLNLFADSYSSFTLDEASGSYKVSSITLNGTAYTEAAVTLSDSKLTRIEYKAEGTTYVFADFGNSLVTLPTIA